MFESLNSYLKENSIIRGEKSTALCEGMSACSGEDCGIVLPCVPLEKIKDILGLLVFDLKAGAWINRNTNEVIF